MSKYAIVDYIPRETRERVAGMTYERGTWLAYQAPCPVNAEGYCPLGQAVQDHSWAPVPPRPTPTLVGRVFGRGARRAAAEFMRAWDQGLITDLPAALGVAGR